MSDTSFTPSTYAIFRHVWSLPQEQRSLLDKYFIMRTTALTLIQKIDKSHEYKLLLPHNLISYELEFIDCSYEFIRSSLKKDTPLLISMRYNKTNRMAIALVAIPHRREWKSVSDRFQEFV